MEAKKKLLTYAGLKALEEELENLKVVKRKEVSFRKIKEVENRETYQRMRSMILQKMSSVILRLVSRSWKQFSRTLRSL